LSIVFVAAEILRGRQGYVGITARAPWVVALMFGLMHGLGFASGLKDAGLPDGHIPTALLFFSIGVEAGHFLFIGCVLAITAVMLQAMSKLAPITQQRSAILQMVPPLRYRHCGDVLGHSTGGRVLSQSKCTYAARSRPTIYHSHEEYATDAVVRGSFAQYRESLRPSVRSLLDHFEFKDWALKVVGVGSVGTLCAVLLLMADDKDPLFLQVKEARASVLEAYAGKSVFANHGERCVNGHRMMQSASDVFLGCFKGTGKLGRHFYIRQLRDVKLKPKVEVFNSSFMIQFGECCGWTLAHAHARNGQPAMIGGYLGNSDTFDKGLRIPQEGREGGQVGSGVGTVRAL
jgi:hypothetical protein